MVQFFCYVGQPTASDTKFCFIIQGPNLLCFLMEPADIMENHGVENDDSNEQETLPLEMLRFLSKHFSRHCNPVVKTFI